MHQAELPSQDAAQVDAVGPEVKVRQILRLARRVPAQARWMPGSGLSSSCHWPAGHMTAKITPDGVNASTWSCDSGPLLYRNVKRGVVLNPH